MVNSILPLTADSIILKRRDTVLLGPVSLTIAGDGITAVLGANGAGKTTLLRALHGMERVSGGHISWSQPDQTARRRQAFVFQSPVLLRRTVLDNLCYPLSVQGQKSQEARAIAKVWAEKVGLVSKLSLAAQQLSGGEKQKLALARALTTNPEVLFLDEPCASLDGAATREIETILHEAQTARTRIVMATHNVGQAQRLATDVIILSKGQMVETASAKAFFTAPKSAQGQALLSGGIVD